MLEPGELFDRYRIVSLLGRGGNGAVFRAHDERLRRPVALKILEKLVSPEARSLLLREARAAAGLSHPNIVVVHDVGEARGITYMAMELVEGKPLRAHLGEGISPTQAVRWLLDMARGLAEAHRAGLVHRDVKPANVMITAAGAKMLDFGIAKPSEELESKLTALMPRMRTTPGFAAGTPRYMAPETLQGTPATAAADQFAWGLVAHELLVGRHPRVRDLEIELAPTSLIGLVSVPPEIAAIVGRALDNRPERRFASMQDVARALAPLAGPSSATMEFRAFGAPPEPPEEEDVRPPTRMITATGAPVIAGAPSVAAAPVRAIDPGTLAPFAEIVSRDLAMATGGFFSALAIITVDVTGQRGRFFVQTVAIGKDGQLQCPPASADALRAAGSLIAADARAGNGRWARLVVPLDAEGLPPGRLAELS